MRATKILVLGFGKMAKAAFGGVGPAVEMTVIKPSPLKTGDVSPQVRYYPSVSALPPEYSPDMVLFAMKPEALDEVLAACAKHFDDHSPLYVSIIASKPISYYRKFLGEDARILRTMPNLTMQVGAGITLVHPSTNCSADDVKMGSALFSSQSQVIPCKSEAELDKLTVHTGCTPGFLFAFCGMFSDALKQSLPKETTLSDAEINAMALKLIEGVVRYAQAYPNLSFEQMANQVATKGGLTEAGLNALKVDGDVISAAFTKAIAAATARGEEIAAQNRQRP